MAANVLPRKRNYKDGDDETPAAKRKARTLDVKNLKLMLAEKGIKSASQFLKINAIPQPDIKLIYAWGHDLYPEDGMSGEAKPLDKGRYYHRSKVVKLNLARCGVPVTSIGCGWSIPCSKSDTTPMGVICHEMGHHVHHFLGYEHVLSLMNWYDDRFAVSGYHPNKTEALAEAMRIFILNPDMLRRKQWPWFDFFTKTLGLKPMCMDSLESVLIDAPARVITSVVRWVSKK